MAELAVARTYGSALFEAARDLDKIELIKRNRGNAEIFKSNPEFMLFLKLPSISHDEKKAVLHDLFEGQFSREFLNFMDILIEKGRMRRFEKIASVYTELVNTEEGITVGIIYSAVPSIQTGLKGLKRKRASFSERTCGWKTKWIKALSAE